VLCTSAAALLVSACSTVPTAGPPATVHLALVAYSIAQEAYARLIRAFQLTRPGANVTVDTSLGSSGAQTQAVSNGLAADVVAWFSQRP